MVNVTSREIRNDRLRILMDAIEIQMGSNGLRMMLRNADLERYIDHPPPINRNLDIPAQEYSKLLAALRAYFGVGARATMLRIGVDITRLKLERNRLPAALRKVLLLALGKEQAARVSLKWLAGEWNQTGAQVVLQEQAAATLLLDASNDRTVGIQAEYPICWTAVGEIAEALHWGTGEEYQIQEVGCIASGDDCCRFSIKK